MEIEEIIEENFIATTMEQENEFLIPTFKTNLSDIRECDYVLEGFASIGAVGAMVTHTLIKHFRAYKIGGFFSPFLPAVVQKNNLEVIPPISIHYVPANPKNNNKSMIITTSIVNIPQTISAQLATSLQKLYERFSPQKIYIIDGKPVLKRNWQEKAQTFMFDSKIGTLGTTQENKGSNDIVTKNKMSFWTEPFLLGQSAVNFQYYQQNYHTLLLCSEAWTEGVDPQSAISLLGVLETLLGLSKIDTSELRELMKEMSEQLNTTIHLGKDEKSRPNLYF